MIHSIKLKNFKSVKNALTQIEMGAITIFAGANSSGKSTIIQSILMMMQTLTSNDTSAITLNGDLVTLGTVEDVWHNSKLDVPILIELILSGDRGNLFYELELMPNTEAGSSTSVRLNHACYAWDDDSSDNYDNFFEIQYTSDGQELCYVKEHFNDVLRSELLELGYTRVSEPEGCLVDMDHFLPSEIRINVEAQSRDVNWKTVLASPLDHEDQFSSENFNLQMPNGLKTLLDEAIHTLNLPPIEQGNVKNGNFKKNNTTLTLKDYWDWFGSLQAKTVPKLKEYFTAHLSGVTENRVQLHRPEVFSELGETAVNFFVNKVRYLSANRIAPTALFELGTISKWSEVGIDGGNVAGALSTFKDKNIRYLHPTGLTVEQGKLIDAVLIWLNYFGLIESIETKDYGKLGTFLSIKSFGVEKELDLTAVGFGTSQILPIVVQGLLTPLGGLFIVEQPEVHMHPKVQSQLAYFFFALSKVGVQCIAETHSEYIVNQLRLLMARGNKVLQEQTRIYFAKRTEDSGTEFEEVKVNKSGHIKNWPEDFMDESNKLAQELLKVAIAIQ